MSFNYWQGETLTQLPDNGVFVFGSNAQGYHGAGAAKSAKEHFGAIRHQGRGLMNNCYGLVTKNLLPFFTENSTGMTYEVAGYGSVSLEQISQNISELITFASENTHKNFYISYTNDMDENNEPKKRLSGYTPLEIMTIFAKKQSLPSNLFFHDSFKVILEENSNTIPSYYFFYGKRHPFSQHHQVAFSYKSIQFNSTEQFMMYSKAMLFDDYDAASDILLAMTPAEMAKIGRRVKNFDNEIWLQKRKSIVYVGNREKFEQNENLLNFLLSTAGQTLAEASPSNIIWGIGLDINNPDRLDKDKWRGENLLGHIITELRDVLLIEYSPVSEQN
jgi:ribA/ribD-fused uncharacterized protein